MEKKPVQLTKEELDKINTLSDEYRAFVFQCGELHLQMAETRELIMQLEEKEKNILESIEKLREKEKETVNSLLSKYGEGSISIKDGTFIPD